MDTGGFVAKELHFQQNSGHESGELLPVDEFGSVGACAFQLEVVLAVEQPFDEQLAFPSEFTVGSALKYDWLERHWLLPLTLNGDWELFPV